MIRITEHGIEYKNEILSRCKRSESSRIIFKSQNYILKLDSSYRIKSQAYKEAVIWENVSDSDREYFLPMESFGYFSIQDLQKIVSKKEHSEYLYWQKKYKSSDFINFSIFPVDIRIVEKERIYKTCPKKLKIDKDYFKIVVEPICVRYSLNDLWEAEFTGNWILNGELPLIFDYGS